MIRVCVVNDRTLPTKLRAEVVIAIIMINKHELLIWSPYMVIIYTYTSLTTYAHMSQADATDKIFCVLS